ncbi:hypothetical protein F2P56_026859 [Juglans regia]|uniref:Neurofilament medium polypeptide-like n=2 Tax=Juglans regia TaxID=51240 RepID=A0A2I4GS99_JUGRE|nr:neurofilament medium polypeptide-like [Juglans regia]KAF5451787.1 hypothetical protein F2P56_026859 [Juglans regia]
METQASRPRPLFRLPTIFARPTAPVDPIPNPAPALEPRPPMLRPASIRPLAGTFQQPRSQEPTPRPSAVVSPAARGTAPLTPEPPKTIEPIVQTLPQSPKPKPTTPPPSALTILSSQLQSQCQLEQKIQMEVQQKDVVVQIKTIGKEEVSKENETKETVKSSCKNILNLEEVGMRVITIAGENKGAFMKLIQSSKKHEVVHKNENPKTKSHGNDWESTSSDKAVGNLKKNKSHEGKVTSSMPKRAFVNSNVQCVNNSILYNCSCTHHDPGVHLALSRN